MPGGISRLRLVCSGGRAGRDRLQHAGRALINAFVAIERPPGKNPGEVTGPVRNLIGVEDIARKMDAVPGRSGDCIRLGKDGPVGLPIMTIASTNGREQPA